MSNHSEFPALVGNTNPRFLTIAVIGLPDYVEDYILQQYTYGFAQPDEWSQPMPVIGRPGKVVTVLNRNCFG
ncbi:hypothetical protein ACKFKG_27550 [Phormidesmis sp. 146-35]